MEISIPTFISPRTHETDDAASRRFSPNWYAEIVKRERVLHPNVDLVAEMHAPAADAAETLSDAHHRLVEGAAPTPAVVQGALRQLIDTAETHPTAHPHMPIAAAAWAHHMLAPDETSFADLIERTSDLPQTARGPFLRAAFDAIGAAPIERRLGLSDRLDVLADALPPAARGLPAGARIISAATLPKFADRTRIARESLDRLAMADAQSSTSLPPEAAPAIFDALAVTMPMFEHADRIELAVKAYKLLDSLTNRLPPSPARDAIHRSERNLYGAVTLHVPETDPGLTALEHATIRAESAGTRKNMTNASKRDEALLPEDICRRAISGAAKDHWHKIKTDFQKRLSASPPPVEASPPPIPASPKSSETIMLRRLLRVIAREQASR